MHRLFSATALGLLVGKAHTLSASLARRLDGAREPSAFDGQVASLCSPVRGRSAAFVPPRATIVDGRTVRLSVHGGADAAYVTDEEGTILAFGTIETHHRDEVELELKLDDGATPRSLVGVAHDRDSCVMLRGEAVPTWQTVLEEVHAARAPPPQQGKLHVHVRSSPVQLRDERRDVRGGGGRGGVD